MTSRQRKRRRPTVAYAAGSSKQFDVSSVYEIATLVGIVTTDLQLLVAIVLASGVSGAVGVFFGYYPACKASRLDPIQALRHE